MKIFSIIVFSILVSSSLLTGNIHDFTIAKIEGGSQTLSNFQDKKILVVTLPVSQDAMADSMLYELDTLGTAHATELKIIGVPSYEDGYTTTLKSDLLIWYRSKLGTNILITDGMYTHKTSGSQQDPLFKWLTDVTQNEVFDIDVTGPGYKYFANENGLLYGVLRPHSKISGASMQLTLHLK